MKLLIRKGFTLMELIISLALMVIIFVVLTPFFLSNNNTINTTHIKTELQSEGENIMSYISKSFMEGVAVENIDYKESSKVDNIKIRLYGKNSSAIFNLDGRKLIYKLVEDKDIKERIIGSNVEDIKIIPIGGEIKKAKAVNVEIILSNKGQVYKLQNNIYLRNSN